MVVNIIQFIENFVREYNTIGKVAVKVIELSTPFIIFALGARKVSEILKDYTTKKREAVFGFYAQFQSLLISFRSFVITEENKPSNILRQVWSNKTHNGTTYSSSAAVDLLHQTCVSFIQFLLNCPNQVPPTLSKAGEFVGWRTNINELIKTIQDINIKSLPDANRGDLSDAGLNLKFDKLKETIESLEKSLEFAMRKYEEDLLSEDK